MTPQADLANAIHNIFLHPNVARREPELIQKLVTGEPSPQYWVASRRHSTTTAPGCAAT